VTAWYDIKEIETQEWRCGYCGREVASDRGWRASNNGSYATDFVAICPRCDMPSTIGMDGATMPPSQFGESVGHLPDDLDAVYNEARHAVTAGAPNSAALACRKILMHVGVAKGAAEGGSFLSYVNHLSERGYVPPDAHDWIDEIREHGNDANHEIVLITQEEAQNMVDFTAMMLRVIYEYPERGRRAKAARQTLRP